ncbi:monocarboxylate transporter 13-like [Patiria miniata]|uniref:Major facilitator superfamily (MFS) profile domain-containing protein n=1 Tax=Patiria miniata TaxID=46514 RepID=A0A914ABC2_PATMI|nr:monocarboxylate transporter 13-like [Patiria miniata]
MNSPRSPMQTREKKTPESREGGWGIVVVIASYSINVLVLSLLRCGGVLYQSWMDEFETGAKEIAAIQSILSAMTCFCGLAGAVLCKRFGCRFSGILGGVLWFLGLFCSYWVQNIFQLYVTIAIAGVGVGISYTFGLVSVAMHFKKRYKTANAVAFSGSGIGIMAAPPIVQLLLDNYGWRGTLFIISAIMANGIACGALYRPRRNVQRSPKELQLNSEDHEQESRIDEVRPESPTNATDASGNEPVIFQTSTVAMRSCNDDPDEICYISVDQSSKREYASFKDARKQNQAGSLLRRFCSELSIRVLMKNYRFLLVCLVSVEFAPSYLSFALFVIPRAQSIDVAPSSAAFLVSILGIGTLLGQLGNGLMLSCRTSAEHVLAICVALSGVSLLVLNVDGYVYLAIASFLQGFASGAFFAIASVLILRYVGLEGFAVGTGWHQISIGVGQLLGPIVAGT